MLLQVVLQSQIAADEGEFTIDDVCRAVNAKIIRRHPHVFGEAQAGDANSVLDIWDKIKLSERAQAAQDAATSGETERQKPESILASVPVSFPALMQAQKISRKGSCCWF